MIEVRQLLCTCLTVFKEASCRHTLKLASKFVKDSRISIFLDSLPLVKISSGLVL